MKPREVLAMCREKEVKAVDLRFADFLGAWQHLTIPVGKLEEDTFGDGLGFGHNTRAALITRGLAEMIRLASAMGGDPLTLAGLAGMGDLVLTCTGDLSRNRQVGLELGKGRKLAEVLAGMTMVAEGVKTAKSAYELSLKWNVEMPLVREAYRILYEDRPPLEAMVTLMTRELKAER